MRDQPTSNPAAPDMPAWLANTATSLCVVANLLAVLLIASTWPVKAPASCGDLLLRLLPGLG